MVTAVTLIDPSSGSVTRFVFELGVNHLGDVGLLATIVYAWTSGRVPFRDSRWSDDGSALVCRKRLQFLDPELNRQYGSDGLPKAVADLGRTLDFLTKNQFIAAERDASGWVISLGPRLAS
jgi:hypothetical protein